MKLIENWKVAHRYWSVRLSAAGALLMGGLGTLSTAFPGAWASVPQDTRDKLPSWLGFAVLGAVMVARMVRQKDHHDDA